MRNFLHAITAIPDRSLGDLATFRMQKVRNRLQRRRLARPVRADESTDLPWGKRKGEAADSQVVVKDLFQATNIDHHGSQDTLGNKPTFKLSSPAERHRPNANRFR